MNEKETRRLPAALRWIDRKSGLLTTRKNPWASWLLAFFLPMLILGVVWAVQGIFSGSKMILAHDQWHQYFPFFSDFHDRLRDGQSLRYSWNTGMGTNYLALYGYYLASPLNWPVLLLPDAVVLPYYTLLTLLKIGFAGLFFQIFLQKTFERSEPVQAFFSTMYALSSFIMGYYWNAIWLDTVALLPLVALGTIKLLRERKFILYVAALALSVISSYYIGLFTCFFVLLLFICYHVVCWDDLGGFFSRLWRIALFSLLALGISAAVTIPALLGLCSSSSVNNEFPKEIAYNLTDKKDLRGILDALRLIFGNAAALAKPTSFNETLPNVACGATSMTLALVYFFSRRIPVRERICSGMLLLFFGLSFTIRQMDYVWHGFHFPNMLPFRYSFLVSFVLLTLAYRAYTALDTDCSARLPLREWLLNSRWLLLVFGVCAGLWIWSRVASSLLLSIPVGAALLAMAYYFYCGFENFRWYSVLFALPAAGLFLYCVFSSQGAAQSAATAVFVLLTLAGLFLCERKLFLSRNLLTLLLCVMLLTEAVFAAIAGGDANGTTARDSYPYGGSDAEQIVALMKEREEGNTELWRAEFTSRHTLNDSTLFSFPGITVFSSACNCGVTNLLESIGLGARENANRYVYEQSDPAVNLLLGVKYLISRDGRNTDPEHFTTVAQSGNVLLMQNKDYLPMGWVVDPQVLGYDPKMPGTPFDRIQTIYGEMLNTNLKLYQTVMPAEVSYTGGASGSDHVGSYYTFSSDGDPDSRMSIHIDAPEDGQMSVYTKSSNAGSAYLYINDVYQCYYNDRYGCLHWVGALKKGDRVTIRYRAAEPSKQATVTLHAAMLDEEVFRSVHDALAAQTLQLTTRSDTELEGVFTAKTDGLMFTTIPCDRNWSDSAKGLIAAVLPLDIFDGGWTVTVDGNPVRTQPMGGAFVAFRVPAGTHTVCLHYETPGLSVAALLSISCLAAYLALTVLYLITRIIRRPMDRFAVETADAAEEIPPQRPAPEQGTAASAQERPQGRTDDQTIAFGLPAAEPTVSMPALTREEPFGGTGGFRVPEELDGPPTEPPEASEEPDDLLTEPPEASEEPDDLPTEPPETPEEPEPQGPPDGFGFFSAPSPFAPTDGETEREELPEPEETEEKTGE